MPTVGRLLLERAVPREFHGDIGTLNAKGISDLLQKVADKAPDQYREISHKLTQLGANVSYGTGGYSFGLDDLMPTAKMQNLREEIKQEVEKRHQQLYATLEARNKSITDYLNGRREEIQNRVFEEAKSKKNPLAYQIMSGSRGKPADLMSMLHGDLVYDDNLGNPIPFPVLRGFAEGLSPAEAFAESFGSRAGTLAVKNATGEAGYFAKKLTRAAHRAVVTAHDAEDDSKLQNRGLPTTPDDTDNLGALLAAPVGGYARNTHITPAVLRDLREQGVERMLVRSPLASGPADGGVYAADVGMREGGRMPSIGEMVGLPSAQSIAEPVTQGSLSSKHKGGVSGGVSGFDAIDQFVDAPSESPSWATHASRDGLVTSIRPHPAGGSVINVDGEEHYAYPHAVITAQQGDKVEAGDMLTDGLPNPNEFMKHKGIGEGRRLFTSTLHRLLKENGTPASRRHIELVAKGMANHVRFNDEHQEWLPNDVVPYDRVEASWNPRPDAKSQSPKQAIGSYLESPVLHYSIGTRITPKVSAELSSFNVPSVITHHSAPPFDVEYVSGRETLMHDPDWQTRMAGSYLQKSTLDAARTGAVSDEAGTSFVPALALGTGFGTYGKTIQPTKPS